MDDKVYQLIIARMDRLEEKVDRLLAFKWQIIGGSLVASVVLTVALQVVLSIVNK